MQRHSAVASSAYHDLLRTLNEERVADIKGSPFKKMHGGRTYWYETWRIGPTEHKRYIGEDTPELAALIARNRELAATAKARATHRSRLVRILRAEGFLPRDGASGAIYAALAKVGTFRLGGTIVGTHTFRLYEGELGVRYSFDQTAQTDDLDITQFERLSLALDDRVETAQNDTFRDFDFEPVPSLEGNAIWRWRQTRSNTLIVADRRRGGPDAIKAVEDRAQAAFLTRVLAEDRPDDLREAYQDAMDRGPQWREQIGRSLARIPDTAALLAAL